MVIQTLQQDEPLPDHRLAARRARKAIRPERKGQAYIAPAMIMIAAVLIAPSIYGVIYSLYDIKFLRATDFVGLENYYYLVTDPEFGALVLRSAFFAAVAVGLTIAVALPVAIWIDRLQGPFALFVQIIVILPWVVSSLIGSLLFQWVFVADFGWTAHILTTLLAISYKPLSEPASAMAILVLYATWRTLGFAMLILLAGLKSIPGDLYEAAQVDGAKPWRSFLHITLPMLQTSLMITLVILTVSNLNNVEGPLIVTTGGPAGATKVVALDLYTRAFGHFDFNSAIPLGIGMFAANIMLAIAYVRLVKRNG